MGDAKQGKPRHVNLSSDRLSGAEDGESEAGCKNCQIEQPCFVEHHKGEVDGSCADGCASPENPNALLLHTDPLVEEYMDIDREDWAEEQLDPGTFAND